MRRYADAIVGRVSLAGLLGEIDALHTLTSLSGFEALLRGVPVTVYGKPFYAGWGLTTDMAPDFATDLVSGRRGRRLTLEELAAGALILYPRYIDPLTRQPCDPETLIERLAQPALWRPGPMVLARRAQGRLCDAIRSCAPRFVRS
jgi:capsular polysaccharide export protein